MKKAFLKNAMKMSYAFLVTLGVVLTLLVLVMDLFLEDGFSESTSVPVVVGGVAYIAVVLITLWMPGRKYTLIFAMLSSVLTVHVFFFELNINTTMFWEYIKPRELLWDDPTQVVCGK